MVTSFHTVQWIGPIGWDNVWKSQGVIMVNEVPRKVPRPKNPGAAGLEGFWSRDLPRDSIQHDTLKALLQNVILSSSPISIWNLFQPMDP